MLEGIDPGLLHGALAVVRKLRDHGYEAYFAGGVVRDLILGRIVSDIDIATSATPDEIECCFEKTISVGKQFGVIVVVQNSKNYEVTTFREDIAYRDGRHPENVNFTDAKQDVLRRDFTVNALFLDPQTEEVIDYVGGRTDIDVKLIRTVGSPAQRFEEDQLRVLRAVRFASQLGFEIEEETYRCMKQYSKELRGVSAERIGDELLKVFTGIDSARGLRLLLDSGILHVLLPEVAAMNGVPQPPQFHPEGDVFRHTCIMFEKSEEPSETLSLGILLHDVGKPSTYTVQDRIRFHGHAEVGARMADEICRRLRLPTQQIEDVVDLVRDHLRFIHVREMRESTLKRFLRKENFDLHLELHRLDCLASHGNLTNYDFCREKLKEFSEQIMRPKPLISGHDLIALGLRPGPLFSEILTSIEDRQLEEELSSKEQALSWVKSQYLETGD